MIGIMWGTAVKIKRLFKLLSVIWFLLDNGASGVDTDEVSVFVMEGDSVTLHTGVKTNQQEVIKWYYNDTRIAQISGDLSDACTDVQCEDGEERFRDRLKLDHQTGSLTITNIRNTDSGVYELKIIRSSSSIDNVFVFGVSAAEQDEIKSVKKGESLTLDPGVSKSPNDSMMWYFNEILITEIIGDRSKICTDDQCKERFRDRLKLDHQNGSLTITNITDTNSGLYELKSISSSSRFSITRGKRFSVSVTAVPGSGLSSGKIAGTCVGVVLLVCAAVTAAVIYCRHNLYTPASQNDDGSL